MSFDRTKHFIYFVVDSINPKTFKKMKKISVLMMSIVLVGAVALTSCGSKETKAEATTECCEKKDSSACCEKKDSTACTEKKDSCNKPCEGHNADSTKKCAEHKN